MSAWSGASDHWEYTRLARLSLGEIDRRKVAILLGEIETTSGATSRNRARSALSAFFSWCITEGLLDANPVVGTAKANENGSRERDGAKLAHRTLNNSPTYLA